MRKHRTAGVFIVGLIGLGAGAHGPTTTTHRPGHGSVELTSAHLRTAPLGGGPALHTLSQFPSLLLPAGDEVAASLDTLARHQARARMAAAARRQAAAAPPASTGAPAAPPVAAPPVTVPPVAAPAADPWAALRQCESGGNYGDDTGNGYYGAYQFTVGTWRSLGYGGLPSQAPAAEQDQAARQLESRRGWGQWPSCARRLGLG